MPQVKQRIGELLMSAGLLTEEQLDEALEVQRKEGGRLVEACIQQGYFDAQDFLRFLSEQRTAASLDLMNYAIPREVIDLVPAHFAMQHEVLPIDKLGKHLTVGMACPLDTRTIEEMEQMTGCKIRPMLVGMNDIRSAIANYYKVESTPDFSEGMGRRPTLNLPEHKLGSFYQGKSSGAKPQAPPAKPAPADTDEDLAKAESGIRMEGVVGLVRKIYQLPALPETVGRVRQKMEDPNANATDMKLAVASDPGMVAKILSLANSASHGFVKRIDTLEEACRLLGAKEIYQVVLSAAVVDYFKASKFFDYRRFWRHSRFCAAAAKVIVQYSGAVSANAAYVAGLLHGIGRPAFAEIMTERYREVDQESLLENIIAKEESLFGISHPEVGYIMADTWGLPPEMTLPIRYFHRLDEATEEREMVATICLAAIMTDAYGKITKENVRKLATKCRPPMELLGMVEKDFIKVLNETGRLFKDLEADAQKEFSL